MPSVTRLKCDSYKAFETNLGRSRAFLRLFDVDRRAGQPSNDEKELLRGAIVFAIGAFDAFLHELVLEIVPQFGGNRSALAGALREIARDDPGLSLRISLAVAEGADLETEFRDALDTWLEKKSFQGVGRVSNALSYVGVGLSIADFDQYTGVNTAAQLQRFTDMRHQIVHRGARPATTRGSAQDCVNLIATMAEAVNREAVAFYNSSH